MQTCPTNPICLSSRALSPSSSSASHRSKKKPLFSSLHIPSTITSTHHVNHALITQPSTVISFLSSFLPSSNLNLDSQFADSGNPNRWVCMGNHRGEVISVPGMNRTPPAARCNPRWMRCDASGAEKKKEMNDVHWMPVRSRGWMQSLLVSVGGWVGEPMWG